MVGINQIVGVGVLGSNKNDANTSDLELGLEHDQAFYGNLGNYSYQSIKEAESVDYAALFLNDINF